MDKKYTRTEVINLVRSELIKTYGGLSQDADGNKLDTPYMVLGIVNAAIPADEKPFMPDKIIPERDTYCGPQPWL